MRSLACPLAFDAYASLTGPPLRVEHGLNTHTGAMTEAYLHGGDAKWAGGVAEYTLPPCASNGSWASFDLRARVLPRRGGTYCRVIVNTEKVGVKYKSAAAAAAASHRSIGTVVMPALSPHQIAIVIEGLTPGCRVSEPYLEPRGTSVPLPSSSSFTSLHRQQAAADDWERTLGSSGVRPCWRSGPTAIGAVCGGNGTRDSGAYSEHCAYASLILNDRFAAYAYALERSLRASGSEAPLVLLATSDVSDASLSLLTRLGGGASGRLRVRRVTPAAYPSRYKPSWENNETRKSLRFTKLEAWKLTEYRKVVLIDTDTLVLKPIDALFTCPAGSAVADMGAPGNFNSGVFVLEPSLAVYEELRRLTPLLISYNQGDQGFLNKAFPEWRLRPAQYHLPEQFNYLLRQRGSSEWLTSSWQRGVSVVHFTDVIKPHNWFLHPSTKASATAATIGAGAMNGGDDGIGTRMPSTRTLSFVEAQGDMFQRWMAHADRYRCEVAAKHAKAKARATEVAEAGAHSATATGEVDEDQAAPRQCNRTVLELRNRACTRVAPTYAKPAEAPQQFCVLISYAPFRKRLRILQRIERHLQTIPEVHTIFLIEHGPAVAPFAPSGPKPVVEVRPAFDALGNRFGPLAIPTEGVLIMDDDILLEPRDMRHAFATWRQMPTRLVGTWQRAVTIERPAASGSGKARAAGGGSDDAAGRQPPLRYRDYTADDSGMRRSNVILTKLMFVHRDYLFMYSCMLPFELWDLPNRLINCEDVLMDMLVGVASGQPAGVPFQPTYGVQLDFGTPPPEALRKHVKAQAGLSGVVNRSGAIWTDSRTACTNALASYFVDPVMRVPLLKVPAFMAAAPWREIPFEKVWMVRGADGGVPESVSVGPSRPANAVSEQAEKEFSSMANAKRWDATQEIIENGLVDGRLRWEADFGSANSSFVPLKVTPSAHCPSRPEVLNTALAQRWRMWDDGPECADGCFVSQCDAMGVAVAPCCVKRLAATWGVPCSLMPHGCPDPGSSLLERKGIVVGDVGRLATPKTAPSDRCPYRGDVANTPPRDRWHIWHDGSPEGKMGKACLEGCALQNCDHGRLNPCCVKRLKVVEWPIPCEALRFGCTASSGRSHLTWVSKSPAYPFWMSREEVDAPFPWLKSATVRDYHGVYRHRIPRGRPNPTKKTPKKAIKKAKTKRRDKKKRRRKNRRHSEEPSTST